MPKTNSSKKHNSEPKPNVATATAKHARTLRAVAAKPVGDSARKIERSAASAKQTAQIGVIAYIMQLLRDAKQHKQMRTFAELHEAMCAYFSQRKASGLAITLRAQLSRLPNEKQFAIAKNKAGRITTYAEA